MKKGLCSVRFVLSALLLASSVCTATAQQMQSSTPSANEERQWVTIKGAVRNPVRLELRRRVRLLEALAMAGGVTERAKGSVQIERASEAPAENLSGKPSIRNISQYGLSNLKRGDKKANPYLRAGDVITILE